ncbi:MAG: DEAD/DEAH box helicase family protein, partial [Hyphomicrobiales bacterium]
MPHVHSDTTALANPAEDVRTRLKLEGGKSLVMHTEFEPAGDQPTAIAELTQGVTSGEQNQVLLGATGTGKTFTMANV